MGVTTTDSLARLALSNLLAHSFVSENERISDMLVVSVGPCLWLLVVTALCIYHLSDTCAINHSRHAAVMQLYVMNDVSRSFCQVVLSEISGFVQNFENTLSKQSRPIMMQKNIH